MYEIHLKRIAAVTKLSDFSFPNDLKSKKDLPLLKASKKLLPNSILCEAEENAFKQEKLKNNGTLSLHIAAYKNSVDSDTADSNVGKTEGSKSKNEKTTSMKKLEASKQVFTGLSSFNENSFKFPRQQEDQSKHLEVMQFKGSRRLRNPNEDNLNINDNDTVPHNNRETDLSDISVSSLVHLLNEETKISAPIGTGFGGHTSCKNQRNQFIPSSSSTPLIPGRVPALVNHWNSRQTRTRNVTSEGGPVQSAPVRSDAVRSAPVPAESVIWNGVLEPCRERMPEMPETSESGRRKIELPAAEPMSRRGRPHSPQQSRQNDLLQGKSSM
uniref:Uncharacterized protein n=1 Tax=Panagrolaimus sp. ES5 TaxID=591445 RepID=A0AC34G0G3_9BILA